MFPALTSAMLFSTRVGSTCVSASGTCTDGVCGFALVTNSWKAGSPRRASNVGVLSSTNSGQTRVDSARQTLHRFILAALPEHERSPFIVKRGDGRVSLDKNVECRFGSGRVADLCQRRCRSLTVYDTGNLEYRVGGRFGRLRPASRLLGKC